MFRYLFLEHQGHFVVTLFRKKWFSPFDYLCKEIGEGGDMSAARARGEKDTQEGVRKRKMRKTAPRTGSKTVNSKGNTRKPTREKWVKVKERVAGEEKEEGMVVGVPLSTRCRY